MMDANQKTNDIEYLDAQIETFLNGNDEKSEQVLELDPESEALLSIARKVVSQAQEYPGTPVISTQQRLAMITAYRALSKMKPPKETKGFRTLAQNTTFRWAAATSVVVLIAAGFLLTSPAASSTLLSGSAGLHSTLLPVILLGLIAAIVIVYLVFWRKK